MSKKTVLCISNDNSFLLFCQAAFNNDFDLLFASHTQLDLYYTRIPQLAGILISEKDASPEQIEKTFVFLQRARKNSVVVCTENLGDTKCSTNNVVLTDENFKKNVCLKLEIDATKSTLLTENTRTLENQTNYSKKNFKEQLDLASKCDSLVLLVGETGSGKTLAARYIHYNSCRKEKPFIEESLANINPNLIESTLFGTTTGAFTSAENKMGLLESANGGTILLDEVAAINLESQGKFLRFLDTRVFRKLGSQKEIKCNTRIILATNADLIARIKAGLFKEELFQRISVFVIKIPPLRERKDEIKPLAVQFATSFGKKLSAEAIEKLEAYSWPGNIRELKSCIERSSVQASSEVLSDSDIILLSDCF